MDGAMLQASYKPCPECGGQRVVAVAVNLRKLVIETGSFGVDTVPVTCVDCGYTALFAVDPNKVRKYYLK